MLGLKRNFFFLFMTIGSFLLADTHVQLTLDKTQALSVAIHTDRLMIRSLEPDDLPELIKLFGDPIVMAKFATGLPRTPELSTDRFNIFYERWQTMDPFSAMAITLLEDGSFVGLIALSHEDEPGVSELSFLLNTPYWNCGYGKEAARAVVHHYAYELILEGYCLEGSPLRQIVATARTDNIGSIKILEDLGMQVVGTSQKFGADRLHFALDTSQIQPDQSHR